MKKYLTSIVLIAATLIFGGCTPEVHNIVIDPECPAEYVQAVLDGTDAWEEALGIDYWDSITVSDEGTNVWCSTWPKEYISHKTTSLAVTIASTEIYFNLDKDDKDITKTATHELGHMLGYRDHLPPGNLMAPYDFEQTPYITDADIEAVLETLK